MWKALCGLMICWSAITASSSPLDHSPLPPPLPLPQIQSAPLRYCSLTVAICRRKTAYITDQSPASLAGIWSCICWAESRDTNTSEGDGGGYFQFEPVTQHDGLAECQPRFRAVPGHEIVDGEFIPTLRFR